MSKKQLKPRMDVIIGRNAASSIGAGVLTSLFEEMYQNLFNRLTQLIERKGVL